MFFCYCSYCCLLKMFGDCKGKIIKKFISQNVLSENKRISQNVFGLNT